MLEVEKLSVAYGRARVLFDISFAIGENAAVAILGRNGAGKSTLFKALMGLVKYSAARLDFADQDIRGRDPDDVALLGVGYVPEERRIFTSLSVAENLETGRKTRRGSSSSWDESRVYDLFPRLAELRTQPAGRISGGEQQMLAIARTLMGDPTLLLLDEPAEGLAPVLIERLSEALAVLRREGMTLLLAEQGQGLAEEICDAVLVLEKGELRHSGDLKEFLADRELRRRYLAV